MDGKDFNFADKHAAQVLAHATIRVETRTEVTVDDVLHKYSFQDGVPHGDASPI